VLQHMFSIFSGIDQRNNYSSSPIGHCGIFAINAFPTSFIVSILTISMVSVTVFCVSQSIIEVTYNGLRRKSAHRFAATPPNGPEIHLVSRTIAISRWMSASVISKGAFFAVLRYIFSYAAMPAQLM